MQSLRGRTLFAGRRTGKLQFDESLLFRQRLADFAGGAQDLDRVSDTRARTRDSGTVARYLNPRSNRDIFAAAICSFVPGTHRI
jgi:hypothetical protein